MLTPTHHDDMDPKRTSAITTWMRRLVWSIAILIGSILLLLQFSSVQTFLIAKLTGYISEKTNTEITAKRIKISPFDGIILQDFILFDANKDTIASIGGLNISLYKNLFSVFSNQLDLSYIGIKDLHIHIVTLKGASKSNIQTFLDDLSGKSDQEESSKEFLINIREIELSDIHVVIRDENKGKENIIFLKGGSLDIEMLDFDCKDFVINQVILDNPKFESITFEEPLIQDEADEIEKLKDELSDIVYNQPLSLILKEFAIQNGYLGISNQLLPRKTDAGGYLDFNNFYYENINLLITDVNVYDKDIFARLETLNAKDNTGFSINNIKADSILIGPNASELRSFLIDMGKTHIKDNLKFSYNDFDAFKDFAHEVNINAEFKNSTILIQDLMHFVHSLDKNVFVRNISQEIISLSGKYYGRVNNLAGRDVNISLGDKAIIKGSFNTRDLLDPDNTLLNIKLDRFSTSIKKLKMLAPSFNPPPNFMKLGNVNFVGRFDGFLEDFVAYGKLKSDIGIAELDMKLDITENLKKFSGKLNLNTFDLGVWSDNPDLGLVNFESKIEKGHGFTLNTVQADLSASIKSLEFKKYQYTGINLKGEIDKNTFSGSLSSEDPNLNFVFDGNLEYVNKKAFLDFKSNIHNIDLHALNLSEKPARFKAESMNINLSGSNINDFIGVLSTKNFELKYQDSLYNLASLTVTSRELATQGNELVVESDLGYFNLSGSYDLPNVIRSVKKVIYTNYTQLTKPWKEDIEKLPGDQGFDFNINLNNSKNFLSLLGLKGSHFSKLTLKGKLDTYKNELTIAADIPFFSLEKEYFKNIQLYVNSDKRAGNVLVHVDTTFAINKKFNPIDIETNIVNDTLSFSLATEKVIDTLENLDIGGVLTTIDKGYRLKMKENLLVFLGKKWELNPQNLIEFGKEYIRLDDVVLSDGFRMIEFNDFNNHRGVGLDLVNFDLNLINALSGYENLHFGGLTTISAKIQDAFIESKEVSAYISTPALTINKESYGAIYLDVSKSDKNPFKVTANIGDFIGIIGTFDDVNKVVDSRIKLREAPLKIVGYLLKDGIRDTEGLIDADITFGGPTSDLKLSGEGVVNKGKTTVIYTGGTYFFDKQKLRISNTEISLDGAEITDIHGNKGLIRGGLFHNLFRAFGVNATLSGQNVVVLNTTKSDNPDYYGYGIGQVNAVFKGLFEQVDIKINAVTATGTRFYMPIENSESAISQSFIKFVKRDSSHVNRQKREHLPGGLDIELTITITPEAELSLIFDEEKGDVIKGRGRGNIKMDITRRGDFEMFGDYEIESGQYLFTAPLIPVAKPFIVERGGRIVWTGDPVNASIDITAKYRTRTAMEPFISEYLVGNLDPQLNLARQNTEVDVELFLGGTLFNPDIKFGLSFPNLTGELANYADNKLKILEGNDQELNGQVLGLIVFNSFIQSNRVSDIFGASGFQSAGINTLSDFLSSQLSMYITNMINTMVGDEGVISGVDFGVNFKNNNFGVVSSNFAPDEIAVRNTIVFKNDRLSLDIGGNYVLQYQGTDVNQVLPDFALEFRLTKDRKLKIRLYGKYDIDITTTGLREKYGLGVAYRTEFGSMTHFEDAIQQAVKTTIEQ
ncbi:MAG: translocation/assembly module TamB [Chitinophagales bacterium]|nr:translocation/assembly module TamB [Chitinophagales bacterium]